MNVTNFSEEQINFILNTDKECFENYYKTLKKEKEFNDFVVNKGDCFLNLKSNFEAIVYYIVDVLDNTIYYNVIYIDDIDTVEYQCESEEKKYLKLHEMKKINSSIYDELRNLTNEYKLTIENLSYNLYSSCMSIIENIK